ncbi:hypothetical protein GGR57DRAFT_513942 [Xylariaceae sp. FL1272]|nr:hypothetical protein GGR57DRAFT_513942 [Xylariaceae sp. FL1272]
MASNLGDGDQYPVYLGLWTNWSRGRVLGLTLTLTRQDANLLVAFTAFFVAFIGTRFWRVACFAFHQFYAAATPQTAVYHQRQAILRNSSTPESGMRQLLWLSWSNRDRLDRFAPLPMATVGFLCVVTFIAAGGLSSQISTAVGNEVLIQSLNCGVVVLNNVQQSDTESFFKLAPTKSETIDNAANYAQQCYSNLTGGNLDCGRFLTKKLTSSVDTNASCPFDDKICRSTSNNLRIDSGYISTDEHLGINSRDRFFVREILHCAPLTTTGYTSQQITSIGNLTLYHYGKIMGPSGWKDYVFAAKSIESQYAFGLSPDYPSTGSSFGVSEQTYPVMNKTAFISSAACLPIDAITRDDADVTIAFLSGDGVVHSAPSSDEWYRVSPTPVSVSVASGGESVDSAAVYLPLEPASPLGCATSVQYCHGTTHNCGPLASFRDARSSAALLFNTPISYNNSNNATGDSFSYFSAGISAYQSTSLGEVLEQLGPMSLASKSSLTAGIQGPLPSNQWQSDVLRWWDIIMASLQASYLGISYFNPSDPSLYPYRTNFTSEGFKRLCHNQKIRSTNFTSFSVFGLVFTYVAGGLIILLSYSLEPISQLLYKRWGFREFAHLEWKTSTTLQFQRLAHEQIGSGTWSQGLAEVPVTRAGDVLSSLDISNPDHPVLRSPTQHYRFDKNSGPDQKTQMRW